MKSTDFIFVSYRQHAQECGFNDTVILLYMLICMHVVLCECVTTPSTTVAAATSYVCMVAKRSGHDYAGTILRSKQILYAIGDRTLSKDAPYCMDIIPVDICTCIKASGHLDWLETT